MRTGRRGLIATTIVVTLGLPTVAQATVDAPAPRKLAPAPILVGEVGPGYTITLKTPAGAPVRRVRPGRYTFVVRDRATNHDFRLKGPGLNLTTGVAPRVTKRWTVRLRAGRYVYLCTPHPIFMRGFLVVR